MGDKIRAKQTVSAAGVPVVPGRTDLGMTDADLLAAAEEVGFPVLVKPSAGGGGKGMRLVHDRAELPEALVSARREAASSFGDDTLFLERFVTRPRHIEVQVLADAHGTTLHLGERECSLQRRHQKVVEEAPSVLLDAGAARARTARSPSPPRRPSATPAPGRWSSSCRATPPDEPFFMEMNTRLQVEHPVTELVTGLDLVEQQLRVAAGEPLALRQDDVRLIGHAVEVRVYAEDPSRGFLPTGGTALLDCASPRRTASGSTARCRRAARSARRTTRCSARSSPGGRTGRRPWPSSTARWPGTPCSASAPTPPSCARCSRTPTCAPGGSTPVWSSASSTRWWPHEVPPRVHVAYALARLLALPTGDDPWQAVGGWRPSGAAETSWDVAGPGGERLGVRVSGPPQAARVRVGDGAPWRHRPCGTRTASRSPSTAGRVRCWSLPRAT